MRFLGHKDRAGAFFGAIFRGLICVCKAYTPPARITIPQPSSEGFFIPATEYAFMTLLDRGFVMAKVHDYSTNPLSVLPVSELGDGRFFGIELEYSFIPEISQLPEPYAAIFKYDSSIGYDGAELVSAPMLLESIPAWLDSIDMREWVADDRCGMHVHINRAALCERQIALIVALVEDDDFYSFVREMAGRDFASSYYCKKSKGKPSGSRYQAVNLTRKSTVEIRIFAGSSNKEKIWERLQWVNDLVQYAAQPEAKPSYASFMIWRGDLTQEEYEHQRNMIRRKQVEEEKRVAREQARREAAERRFSLMMRICDIMPWVAGGVLAASFCLAIGSSLYFRSINTEAPPPPPIEHVE